MSAGRGRGTVRGLALAAIVWVGLADPATAADLEAAHGLAREGNRAYEAGEYARAVDSYRAALDQGLDDGILHYNLGNALYKQGELGRAIASFARAERLLPRDPQVRANLERARSQIRDRELSPHHVPQVLRPLAWLYGVLSLDEWSRLLLLLVALLAALRIVGQWKDGRRALLRRAFSSVVVLAAISAIMVGLHYRSQVLLEKAVVVVEEIGVRSGPGSDYNLAFEIHEGLQVRVAERRGGWARVDLGGELVGWVPADQIEIL